jgi:hypothetical protein
MIGGKNMIVAGVMIMLILAKIGTVHAESAKHLVAAGNQAFANGKYDEALRAYEKAAVAEPESARILFNKGAAEYMQGNFQQAIELFEQAAVKSRATELEARCHYNMGNGYFRESERQRDSDLKKSLAALQQSIASYQKGLQLDPELADAARNIEVARLTMKKVLDEMKKQQEQAAQQQKEQQQAADNLEDLINRQEKLADQTKESADETRKGDSRENKADKSRELAEQQQKIREETEKLQKRLPSPPVAGDQAGESARHLENARDQQAAAEERLARNDLEEAHTAQQEAAAEMKKAKEALAKKGEKSDSQPHKKEQQQGQKQTEQKQAAQQQDAAASPAEAQAGTGQQAAVRQGESAAAILNEEKENRRQRQIPGGTGYQPVERDW